MLKSAGAQGAGRRKDEAIAQPQPPQYTRTIFKVSSAGFKIPPSEEQRAAQRSSSEDEAKLVRAKLFEHRMSWNAHKLVQALTRARLLNVELEARDYLAGLRACFELADRALKKQGDGAQCQEAYPMYLALRKVQEARGLSVPADAMAHMLRVCLLRVDCKTAEDVALDCFELGYPLEEAMMCDLLSCLARSREGNVDHVAEVYGLFQQGSREEGWQGEHVDAVYRDVVRSFVRCHQTTKVLQVMRDMMEQGLTPSPDTCRDVLNCSLYHADAEILLILATLYSSTHGALLQHGVLERMLQVAAAAGEPKLGQLSMQLLARSGHAPRAADYACWIRACVQGQDFVGAVEALMEAHEQGLDLLREDHGPGGWTGGVELQEVMAADLSRSVRRLDDVYFALVDLVRGNFGVPRMAVNAVVMAAGRMGQIDRSFATFQEGPSLFGLEPDVHAYNALLWACAANRDASVHTLLSVFQEMESKGVRPDAQSFSVLLQTMSDCEDLKGFPDIAALIKAEGVRVKSRALRCVAVALAKAGDFKGLDLVMSMLLEGGDTPRFLQLRIDKIRLAHNKVRVAAVEESPGGEEGK